MITEYTDQGAALSLDALYRWRLWRVWNASLPRVLFVMLNPSTADASQDDPTIRRCVGFAERLGGGSLEVVNLFGLRATDPAALLAAPEPVGEDNDRTILEAVGRAWYVIAAWGAEGGHLGRASAVMKMLAPLKDLYALRVNKDGSPGHPLYLRGDSKASLFQVRSSTP